MFAGSQLCEIGVCVSLTHTLYTLRDSGEIGVFWGLTAVLFPGAVCGCVLGHYTHTSE